MGAPALFTQAAADKLTPALAYFVSTVCIVGVVVVLAILLKVWLD